MTKRVDYDRVAPDYDARYERNDYSGVEQAVLAFVSEPAGRSPRVLEVGCGTGHWVHVLRRGGVDVIGLDLSARMLQVARAADPGARLLRARAEALPCRTDSVDRIVCVNALHHFGDPEAFFGEARRTLRSGGALLTIGLDPHTGTDRWWIYDYFPRALAEDRKRYLAADRIRDMLRAAGFSRTDTREVQHRPVRMTVSEAARRGFLDRTSTSQLMVITENEFDAGLRRVHADAATSGGAEPIVYSDLRIYATTASLT